MLLSGEDGILIVYAFKATPITVSEPHHDKTRKRLTQAPV